MGDEVSVAACAVVQLDDPGRKTLSEGSTNELPAQKGWIANQRIKTASWPGKDLYVTFRRSISEDSGPDGATCALSGAGAGGAAAQAGGDVDWSTGMAKAGAIAATAIV